jgi:hypothetical protein
MMRIAATFRMHCEDDILRDRSANAEPPERAEFRVADTPWFWLALFGTVAVVALAIVGQKYAKRQLRLEMRYEHRMQAQTERAARAAGQPKRADEVEAPLSEQTAQPKATLTPLFALFGVMAVVGYVGLAFAWRQHVMPTETARSKP